MEEKQKQSKKDIFWEICRFLLVGGAATLADYFTFWLFDGVLFPLLPIKGVAWETVGLIVATALGFCVGLVVNWVYSVRFVFRAVKDREAAGSKRSFAAFTAIGLLGLAITELGVVALVAILPELSFFGSAELLGTAWEKWLAKAVMTAVVLVFNYVARKTLIFRS